jgi:murein DD-endopeptidase MepM/ murein hydrolase activator NlpD
MRRKSAAFGASSRSVSPDIITGLLPEQAVKAGDIVQARQQIGTIGPTNVNGGYKPHFHFGVRQGRMAEKGRKLVVMMIIGKASQFEILELRKDTIVLSGAGNLPDQLQVGQDGRKIQIAKSGDKAELDPALLSYAPLPEFMIEGYGLSTDGWADPVAFLKARGADVIPVPFGPAKRRRVTAAK